MIGPKVYGIVQKSLLPDDRIKLNERQNGACPWCGHGLDPGRMAAHHRLLRSHGGTWDMANIVGLHHGCHNVQPGSVHQEPAKAYRLGFMIKSTQLTPAQVPIYSRNRRQWLLADGDDYKGANPSEALELIAAAGGIPADGIIW